MISPPPHTALAPGLLCGPESPVCVGMRGALGRGHSSQAELFRGVAEGCLALPGPGKGLVHPKKGVQACKFVPGPLLCLAPHQGQLPSHSAPLVPLGAGLTWPLHPAPQAEPPLPCDTPAAAQQHRLAGGEPIPDCEERRARRPVFLSEW